jgi:hypothetical protein
LKFRRLIVEADELSPDISADFNRDELHDAIIFGDDTIDDIFVMLRYSEDISRTQLAFAGSTYFAGAHTYSRPPHSLPAL